MVYSVGMIRGAIQRLPSTRVGEVYCWNVCIFVHSGRLKRAAIFVQLMTAAAGDVGLEYEASVPCPRDRYATALLARRIEIRKLMQRFGCGRVAQSAEQITAYLCKRRFSSHWISTIKHHIRSSCWPRVCSNSMMATIITSSSRRCSVCVPTKCCSAAICQVSLWPLSCWQFRSETYSVVGVYAAVFLWTLWYVCSTTPVVRCRTVFMFSSSGWVCSM